MADREQCGTDGPAWERACPYCGQTIDCRPYWNHVAKEHPEEYENSRATWFPLYKDYSSAGMDIGTILMVMTELFNTPAAEIESFLLRESFQELVDGGSGEQAALEGLAESFGKDVAVVKAALGK